MMCVGDCSSFVFDVIRAANFGGSVLCVCRCVCIVFFARVYSTMESLDKSAFKNVCVCVDMCVCVDLCIYCCVSYARR
jgi:hypothetical protein